MERMIVQKLGRLLRHPEPIILIPFFKNTREEEIVNKMCEHYNKTNSYYLDKGTGNIHGLASRHFSLFLFIRQHGFMQVIPSMR